MMQSRPDTKANPLGYCAGIGLLTVLLATLLFTAGSAFAQAAGDPAQARPPAAPQGAGDVASDYWRALRKGETGKSSGAPGGSSDLINVSGQAWMEQRNGEVYDIGAWAFALFAGGVALFYLARGTVRVQGGNSGQVVERWTLVNRVIHWWVAVLFILQLLTGLALLYGKPLLIPLLGKSGFASLALLSKNGHNYLGPLLFVGLVVMVVAWLKHNLPKWVDVTWFAKGGGLVGKGHPSAGYLNGGEKVWYWIVVFAGGLIVVTGMILDFPNFGQTRETMQEMHYLHTVSGLIMGAAMLGHIYIATLGTEGAFWGMWNGHVDVNWAEQHHDMWYETVKDQAIDASELAPDREGQDEVTSTDPKPA